MEDNRSIGLNSVITFTLWVTVLAILLATWGAYFAGDYELAQMFGYTACVTTGVTAVFTLRCASGRNRSILRRLLAAADAAPRGLS